MNKLFSYVFSLILCITSLFFSGCTKKEPPLVILTTGENAPFSMVDKEGKLSGFDIDLIHMIADSMGRKIELKCVSFDEMIKSVQAKQGDIAIGAISITEDREKLVDFSPVYHSSGFVLLMLENTSGDLKDLSNKLIGVRKGTWQERVVKTSWADIPNLFVQSMDRLPIEDIITKLHSGDLIACILDADEAKFILDKNNGFKIVPLDVGILGMGIATAKGSIYSKDISDFINKNKEDIKKLEVKWFSAASN